MGSSEFELAGTTGKLFTRHWPVERPERVALIVHGYGEHSGRYEHVAARLNAEGTAVYSYDQLGHGRSDGEAALVSDLADLVADLRRVHQHVAAENPGVPLVLIGHSLGGLVATRYAQLHAGELSALVLSAPFIGGNEAFEPLLQADPMPEVPIDPAALSRDPAVAAAYNEDPLNYHGGFKRTTLAAVFGAITTITEGPDLGALPVLWLHGDADPLAPLPAATEAIERTAGTNVVRKIYTGSLHEVFNETNSGEVLDDLLRYLNETVPRTAAAS